MTNEEIKKKIISYLGFAKKSGKILVGTDAVLGGIRGKDAGRIAVVLAADASERTKKQIKDKCSHYGVSIASVSPTGDEMAGAVGKRMTLSALAVTDASLAAAILSAHPEDEISAADCHAGEDTQLKERIFPNEREKR